MITEKTVEVQNGKNWKVRMGDGGAMSIVDDRGRERHRSDGHMMTGVHLASAIARNGFDSTSEVDRALKQRADEFVKANGG